MTRVALVRIRDISTKILHRKKTCRRYTRLNASRHNSSGVGGSSNPSSQTPIQSSPNSQYSDFANPHGLDAIDLNDDNEDRRQDSIQHWHWKEDEMLISAWLNVSTDPVVGTDQKGETFWSRIHSYCLEFCTDMTRGVVACKKRWYKINKAVAQFAGCYDQASRNIRSGSNADDIKELAYKLYSTHYGQKFTFERHWNMLRLEQKWRSQLPTQSGGSKRTKVSATGAYSSSSNPETPLADEPGVDSPVRPQGSKKSKRKGKGKAQMSEDFSERKSSVVKKLSLMEDIKNVRENEGEEDFAPYHQFLQRNAQLRNRQQHRQLKEDLIEHIWWAINRNWDKFPIGDGLILKERGRINGKKKDGSFEDTLPAGGKYKISF
ncbi:glutathione S-transferase T3-like [Arachis ipaensis]|uniref:glutathione S-transferase T3-like n=1 Tax=Arachis ipaensis TaxID=130454 RepID=UPI0007AF816E|nr:glutathione S-transferase T3-like [Arachis ipaensis]